MPGSRSATRVGGRFDPMLAKIVAWGPDRPSRPRRLAGALDETVVLGSDHEPAVPALARPPAGRPRRRGPDRHARSDLAAGRLDRRGPRSPTRPGRRAADAPRRRRRRRPGPVGGRLAAQRGRDAPARGRRERTIRRGRRSDRGLATATTCESSDAATSSTSTSPAGAPRSARRRRRTSTRGPGGGRARHRAERGRRPVDIVAPMPGAVLTVHVAVGPGASRPATRSSPSRR